MINMSGLHIMPLPGWHDYRPAFSSLNRPRFHCWAESWSDWLRRVLSRPGILQGHQQIQWNSVNETACAGPVPRSRWPLTHEYSPEARNLIWLPATHYDAKLGIQHTKRLVSNWMHMTEKCMTPFSSDCLGMNSSIVFNGDDYGAEVHTHHVHVAFRYFRTKIRKSPRHIQNLKTCPK